jgi:hypothetical protein
MPWKETAVDTGSGMRQRELIAAERAGWSALTTSTGADYYRRHLSPDAVMVFSVGRMDRDEALTAIEHAPPWISFQIDEPTVVELTEESAVLTYRATARRDGQPDYHAWVSSTYVHRNGDWVLAVHQQSPEYPHRPN